MEVSVSFLSSNNPAKDIKLLNDTDCDFIHVDIMDGKFVKNKTMPFREMRKISKYTDKRLDVHLMVSNPMSYIKKYAKLNTESITIHVEINEDINKLIQAIKSYSIKVGLAIKPNTNVRDLVPYLPYINMILVMSVEPGMGGQSFIEGTDKKIEEVRKLLDSYDLNDIKISVDGGINGETIKYCSLCDRVVSGSYIISSDNFSERIDTLR